MATQTTLPPDLSAIKLRQQAAWASGNYAVIGSTIQLVGETLCEALDLRSGWRVLDVAAGNGNVSLAAARRFCQVTSTDYVPSLLDAGRKRAEADGLTIDFQVADAENLPFPNNTFDVAASSFGIMFTPNQSLAAAEIFRVVCPGGRIGLASWTPTSFVGRLFHVLGSHIPPPAGISPPSLWGTPDHLHQLFPTAASIHTELRSFSFRYLSAEHWLDLFRTFYGPMNKAFAALEETGQAALAKDMLALAAGMNRSGDHTVVIPGDYLEAIITK